MYRKILVPIADDEGARTDAALAVARALMTPDARLVLFHVIESVPSYIAAQIPPDATRQVREEVSRMMEAVAGRAGPGVEVKIETGHGGRTIVERAQADYVDCIVIGSHRPEMQDVLFGSTAAYVVRHAACAVHVLR
ncbi:MAG: universal stress protein [Paracoccaceae bacterium]